MIANLEHERAVLSAIKVEPRLFDELALDERDFSDGKYRATYQCIGRLIESGKHVDDVLLMDSGVPADVIVGLDMPAVSNAAYYAGSIRDLRKRRVMRDLLMSGREAIEAGEAADTVFERIAVGLDEVNGSHNGVKHIRDAIRPAIEAIEARFNSGGGLAGLTSGYTGIDRRLLGFREGQLIVLAARPAIGKTALALSMCARMARKGVKVGFVELEMTAAEIGERLLSIEGNFDLRTIQNGSVNFGRVTEGAENLYSREIWLDDSPKMTIGAVQASARTMVRHGAQIVFVDQLTLIDAGVREGASMYEKTGAAALALKQLARMCKVPVIALHQLNREAENVKPSLAHLAQSGQVEQHADVVMLLHRERRHADRERDGDPIEAELDIAKARGSETGDVPLMFIPAQIKFEERDYGR